MSHGVSFSDYEVGLHYRASLRFGLDPCPHQPEGIRGQMVDAKTGDAFWTTIPAIKQYCTECMAAAKEVVMLEEQSARLSARLDAVERATETHEEE